MDTLSTLYYDVDDELQGQDCVLPQGYDRLMHHLAEGVDVRSQHHELTPTPTHC